MKQQDAIDTITYTQEIFRKITETLSLVNVIFLDAREIRRRRPGHRHLSAGLIPDRRHVAGHRRRSGIPQRAGGNGGRSR